MITFTLVEAEISSKFMIYTYAYFGLNGAGLRMHFNYSPATAVIYPGPDSK